MLFPSLPRIIMFTLAAVLRCLFKLSTSKVFEKSRNQTESGENSDKDTQSDAGGSNNGEQSPRSAVDIDCYAVHMVELCVHSRILLVAGSSHVIVYQFSTVEETLELAVSD